MRVPPSISAAQGCAADLAVVAPERWLKQERGVVGDIARRRQ